MDLNLMNILTYFVLFVVVSLIALHFHISKYFGTLEALGIPCEKPLPFIGNGNTQLNVVQHENDVRMQKKYGRVYGFYDGPVPNIIIAEPEIIREVMVKQFSNFSDHRHVEGFTDPIIDKFLSVLKGEEWKQKKRVVTPAFTSSKLKNMTPLIEKCSTHLLNFLEEKSKTGESIQMKSELSKYLIDVMALCGFGLDLKTQVKDGDKFIKYAKLMTEEQSVVMFTFILSTPVFLRKLIIFPLLRLTNIGLEFFKRLSYDIIKFRQTNNERRNDFLQITLDCLKKEEEMNESKGSSAAYDEGISKMKGTNEEPTSHKIDDVVATAVQFLFTGFETSASTLSFLLYLLATNQECQDKLHDEIDEVLEKNEGQVNYNNINQLQYMEMVIMETIRFYPVVNRFDRECLVTTKINGLTIPKKATVVIPVYAIQHDEEFYPEPEKFDPERFSPENKDQINPYAYFGFGVGPRNCIGMKFALMELKLTLTHILKDYRFICGPKTQIPLQFKKNRTVIVPKDGIELCVEKRSHST